MTIPISLEMSPHLTIQCLLLLELLTHLSSQHFTLTYKKYKEGISNWEGERRRRRRRMMMMIIIIIIIIINKKIKQNKSMLTFLQLVRSPTPSPTVPISSHGSYNEQLPLRQYNYLSLFSFSLNISLFSDSQ